MQTIILIIFFYSSMQMGCAPKEAAIPEQNVSEVEVAKPTVETALDTSVEVNDTNLLKGTEKESSKQSPKNHREDVSKNKEVEDKVLSKNSEKEPLEELPMKEKLDDAEANEIVEENISIIQKEELVKESKLNNSDVRIKKNEPDENIKVSPENNDVLTFNIHDSWDDLLQSFVSGSGFVDYTGLKKSEDKLDNYLKDLSNNAPKKSDKSIKAKVFWINAYNAFTIKLILKNMPVQSIRDISNGEPWSDKWIKLGTEVYSLNNIEHEILRPTWSDARIHFAVNCAAKSCPPISNKAFTESNQDQMLESLSKSFINNSKFNSVSSSKLVLSKIFEWYKSDFGDLVSFIDKYATVKIGSGTTISYQDYDWSLNGK